MDKKFNTFTVDGDTIERNQAITIDQFKEMYAPAFPSLETSDYEIVRDSYDNEVVNFIAKSDSKGI
jgi:hypothetical protein